MTLLTKKQKKGRKNLKENKERYAWGRKENGKYCKYNVKNKKGGKKINLSSTSPNISECASLQGIKWDGKGEQYTDPCVLGSLLLFLALGQWFCLLAPLRKMDRLHGDSSDSWLILERKSFPFYGERKFNSLSKLPKLLSPHPPSVPQC